MTFAELERVIESKKRLQKTQAQERASYDYILADLIGISVSRVYNSSNKMPNISDVYPTIFNKQEVEEQQSIKQGELSAIRFKQFADAFNKKYKKEAEDN